MLFYRLSLFIAFFTLSFSFLSAKLSAQTDKDWKTYTSVYSVNKASIYQGSLWYATEGGMVEFSLLNSTFSIFSNTEGLSVNNCRSISIDTFNRRVIVAGMDGNLNYYDIVSKQWTHNSSLSGTLLNNLTVQGDSILISSNGSFILFDLKRQNVIGIAERLGSLSSGISVLSAESDSKYIWCVTAGAIARVNRTGANFQSPASWTVYSNSQGLTSGSMKTSATYAGSFYVSTNGQGIFRYNDLSGLFENVTSNLPANSYHLLSQDNTLYAYHASSVYKYNNGIWDHLNMNLIDSVGNPFTISHFAGVYNGKYVLISDRSDVCVFENSWKCFPPNTPRANYFSGLKFDANGNLWCSSLSAYGIPGPGFYKIDTRNGTWENFHSSVLPGLPTNNFQNVTVDDSGKIWLGSWSHGLAIYNPVTKTVQSMNYSNGLAALEGLCADGVTMINNIFNGTGNNILISVNKPCDNERALCVYNQTENQFVYYTPSKLLGLINPYKVLLDSYDRYWVSTYPVDITTTGKGIIIIRPTNGITDINSASFIDIDINDGLISNNTTAIAEDKDYTVWIGTDKGLHSFNGFISELYIFPNGPKGEYIKDIHVDRFNNKWIATTEGVSLLNSNGNWIHYNTFNSKLVDNNIISITSDPDGQFIYFGSYNKGLSRLKNPIAGANAGEGITAFPNPFIYGQHDFVSFLSVPDKSYITIMTISGEIVRKISVTAITATINWDGKNSKGQPVASGIYLFHVYPSESASVKYKGKTGKIAVIRK